MAARTLVRYRQLRRLDGAQASDEPFAKGRYFEAGFAAELAIGDLVRIAGPSAGGLRPVEQVSVFDESKMPAVGILVEKATTSRGLVQTIGEITVLSGLVPGRRYFVGEEGRPSSVPPIAPERGIAMIQVIGVALDVDRLLFEPNFTLCRVRP